MPKYLFFAFLMVGVLFIFSSNESALWLLELTPGATVVTWALFEKDIDLGSPKTLLISSKSYDMAGAVNFTTMYECKP